MPWDVEPILISYKADILNRIMKLSAIDMTFTTSAPDEYIYVLKDNIDMIKKLMEIDKGVNLARLKYVKPVVTLDVR